MNKYIQKMLDIGADNMKNMFDIYIRFPWSNSYEVMVRTTKIDLPQEEVQTYEREWHGEKIELPKPEVTIDKKITLSFTLDANFALYGKLKTWSKAVGDAAKGGFSNWPELLGAIKVCVPLGPYFANDDSDVLVGSDGVDQAGDNHPSSGTFEDRPYSAVWEYKDVYCKKCGNPNFDMGSKEVNTYEVVFVFFDHVEPFSNGAGVAGANTSFDATKKTP